jgi:hypothetical protein
LNIRLFEGPCILNLDVPIPFESSPPIIFPEYMHGDPPPFPRNLSLRDILLGLPFPLPFGPLPSADEAAKPPDPSDRLFHSVDMIKRNGGLIAVCASVRNRDDIARSFLHALPAWIYTFFGDEAYNLWIKPGYLMDSDEYEFTRDDNGIWTGGWCTRQETLDCALPSVQIDMSSMMEASRKFNRKVQFTTGMTSLGEQTAGTKASILRRKSKHDASSKTAPNISSQSSVTSELSAITAGGANYVPSDEETDAVSEMSAVTAGGANYNISDDEAASHSPDTPADDIADADIDSTDALSILSAITAGGAHSHELDDRSCDSPEAPPFERPSSLDDTSIGDPSVLSAVTAGGAHFHDDDDAQDSEDDDSDDNQAHMETDDPSDTGYMKDQDNADNMVDDKPTSPTKPPFSSSTTQPSTSQMDISPTSSTNSKRKHADQRRTSLSQSLAELRQSPKAPRLSNVISPGAPPWGPSDK